MRNLILLMLTIAAINLQGQSLIQNNLLTNAHESSIENIEINLATDSQTNAFLFGFIHGSRTPQLVDFSLLKELHGQGVRYYLPEVDYSTAYLLNTFLKNGNKDLLEFICKNYKHRVPQDASVEFFNKWMKVYQFNQDLPASDRIVILGTDMEINAEVTVTHLAMIHDAQTNVDSQIDSLALFKNLDLDTTLIISGKPAMKAGKPIDYFFATDKAKFYNRLINAYKENPEKVLNGFGENADAAKYVFDQGYHRNRDSIIYENWKKLVKPIIKNGGKVYSNFGYTHVFQEEVSGSKYLGNYLKNDPDIDVKSILGIMSDSECLDNLKICADGKLESKGVTFKKGKYCGYKTSEELDGDSKKEVLKGINMLKQTFSADITSIDLTNIPAMQDEDWFLNFEKGNEFWRVDGSTIDNIQHLVYIKNSEACIPIEFKDINQ